MVKILGVVLALALAQPADQERRMAQVLRYAGVENPAAENVARMTGLWNLAQDPAITPEQRRGAYRDLFTLYARLQGQEVSAAAMQGLAQFAATAFDGGARMDLRLPEPRGTPSGRYLHVETRGQGSTPLVLISDLGVDGRKLYQAFVQRNAARYRMSIVTLPWAGAARPLPWPERLDYAARPWLSQIERELVAMLDQPQLKGAVVAGTSAGGYFAARLALRRPRRIRAAVVVDSLVNVPMRSAKAPDAPAPPAERLARLKLVTPAPQLFPFAPLPAAEELRRFINDPKSTHPTARNWMAFAVKDTAVSTAWTFEALSGGFLLPSLEYRWELSTTDLSEELRGLEVPLLAMGAIHDEGSPQQSPPTLSQWEEIRLASPRAPLAVVAFEDSRAYINVEYPREFDRALEDFIAGRPVRGKEGYTLPRASPRASVMQAVGGAEVRVNYSRPAVKGRKVWGELVPYGRVWRAGANEATAFTFSEGVRIQGHALAAGTYTFFVIPAEAGWTMIFNRVPRQWGAFNYNPAFDALRFVVQPAEGEHQERLSYRLDPAGEASVRVILAWEKRRVEFEIAAK
jgi:pimeloyl-ACP methyl ester carboxylesterase